MFTLRSRLLALGALAALLPLSLACDITEPAPRNPDVDDGGDEPPPPVEVDAEALKGVFGCDVAVVALGEQAEGEFADAPCRLEDGRPAVYYAFGLDEAGSVTAQADAAWFDTLLYLYDAEGTQLAMNDDVNPFDTNARLDADLGRGVYVAGVTALDSTSTGFYRFLVSR